MARTGPVTINTSAVPLGKAQIRVGSSSTNIAEIQPILTSSDSIGALAQTRFIGNVDWFKQESGFPLMEDTIIPIREAAALECAFEELTPANMALAYGHDPNAAPYATMETHSGEVPLGARTTPDFVRMEAWYTFPNGTNHFYVLFPRAQVASSPEVDGQAEDKSTVPVVFEAKNADSNVSGGNAAWDDKPYGRLFWD